MLINKVIGFTPHYVGKTNQNTMGIKSEGEKLFSNKLLCIFLKHLNQINFFFIFLLHITLDFYKKLSFLFHYKFYFNRCGNMSESSTPKI